MVREIKTTLALDGEKAFNAALREAEREMRVMNADLKAMAAEYRATDDATKYFAERNETLGRKIKQQEEIVNSLSRAVKESADKFGEAGATTDGYRIKLSNATAKLFDMRREAEEAARELEDLGRDSEKVGTQLERGIGDAAEEVEDKLDGMFAKVSSDVNALKGSVAFQTTMDVGEFVMDGIGSVVDFVNENTELNRMISIAKHNIEQYDFNWEEARGLIVRAAAVTGNQEGAFEAISNLVAAGFDTEELMTSAVDALLGAYLKTGGALSFESLAEDFRASVVSRTPTGTYAEVIEEVLQGVLVEDVQKALEGAESTADAIEIALSVLTKGGLQTKTKTYEEANAELIAQQVKQQELALAWAALAEELAPVVTGLTSALTSVVDKTTDAVAYLKEKINDINDWLDGIVPITEEGSGVRNGHGGGAGESFGNNSTDTVERITGAVEKESQFWQTVNEWISNLFPSAGAETMDAFAAAAMENGSTTLPTLFDDPSMQVDYEPILTDAETAGKDLSIKLANGITIMAGEASAATMKMVDDITAILSMIPVPTIGFNNIGIGGYGTSMQYMPNISIDIDGQTAGSLLYDGVSNATSRATQTKMLVK